MMSNCSRFAKYAVVVLGSLLSLSVGHAQAPERNQAQASSQPAPNLLDEAISHIKTGHYEEGDVTHVMSGGDEAREKPILENLFLELQQNHLLKGLVAATLIRFKDPSDTYYTYLSDVVRIALDSGVPESVSADDIPNASSPSTPLAIWARSRNLTVKLAQTQADNLVFDVEAVVASQDTRFIPLLRRAVTSPNLLAAGFAVTGLAALKDNASIDDVVAEMKKADPSKQQYLAVQLLRFDNDRADSEATPYLEKERLDQMNQRKAERQKEALHVSQASH